MQRVMIIGQPGGGKTWLACQLGVITGLPVVHIDQIHWQAGWVERSREEKTRLCREVQARDAWIFEGGHSVTWPERMARADTLIWIDAPLWLRFWRVLRRTILGYGKTRADLPPGCPEQLNWEFIRWIWDTRKTARRRMRAIFAHPPPHLTCHYLRGPGPAAAYLEALTRRQA